MMMKYSLHTEGEQKAERGRAGQKEQGVERWPDEVGAHRARGQETHSALCSGLSVSSPNSCVGILMPKVMAPGGGALGGA